MKREVIREPSIEICNPEHLITTVAEVQTFDLYKVTTECVDFSSSFQLTVKKTGSLTAIIGYFDVFFDLDNPVHFSTGPDSTPTHWKQTVFSLSEPISITEGNYMIYFEYKQKFTRVYFILSGEIINGKLICRRHVQDVRGLIITIHINNYHQVYYLD